MKSDRAWPLADLRVLDLSTEIAGPYCTKMLADGGAEVVKLEAPGGDPLRRWSASGAPIPAADDGPLFQHLNASKRSVVLDIEKPEGRDALLSLAGRADVFVESFAPGTLARLGLDLATLRSRNPALSLVSITPWGTTGPWASRPATEFTLQAATGSTAYRGLRDRVPVAAGGRIGEWIAGAFAAFATLVAWLSARRTGRGQHADVSMFEAMVAGMTVYHDLSGQWRPGPAQRAIEVPSIEPARDGWVGFCTVTAQQWKDFCVLIGRPEVGEDPRYLEAPARMANLHFMQQVIHPWTRARTVDEIIELATALRVPVTPVGNGATLPGLDHFRERGVFVRGPGGFLAPRPPYQFEKTRLRPLAAAPKLGQDTAALRGERVGTEQLGALFGGAAVTPTPARHPASASPSAPAAATPRGALPLAGVRVIELATFWAGPLAGTLLAAMGADVIKIESVQRPDGIRFAGGVQNENFWEWSYVFAGANQGKRAVTLNLNDAEGRTLVERLLAGADVVIDSFSARVLESFGLGWESVRALNPRIVMIRMPAFGLSGPWRDRPGFAMNVEQVSGMAWLTGYDDLPLVPRGPCDPTAGVHAAFALLLALEDRRRTGEGQLVELPLVETALNVAAEQVIEHSAHGRLLERSGNRGPCAAPQGVYRCADADEYVAVAVATGAQWGALCALLGQADWASDPGLATPDGRRARHDVIDAAIERWLGDQHRDEAAERLVAAGVPAHGLVNPHLLMPNPQLEHRGFFHVREHPVTGTTRYPGLPMSFSELPRDLLRLPPPTLGQHNDEVLGGELALSRAELDELRARKVIGTRPAWL